MSKALVVLGLASMIGFFVGLNSDNLNLRLLTKPIPILILLFFVRSWSRESYASLIAIGLGFSLAGDMLLELDMFIPGIGAFLVAQVCYFWAFFVDYRMLKPLRAIPFVVYCSGIYICILPNLTANLRVPVGAYILVLCAMLWRAYARSDERGRSGQLGVLGAVVFAISDTCIAINKFVGPFSGAREIIIGTYWLGQLGIALSVLPKRQKKKE